MQNSTPFPKLDSLQAEQSSPTLAPDLSAWDGTEQIEKHASSESAPIVFAEIETLPIIPPAIDLETFTRKANEIVRSAHAQAEQIRQNAYQAGYQQGYVEGKKQAEAEAHEVLHQQGTFLRAEVNQFMEQLRTEFNSYLQAIETPILELVMEIARKVIREELRTHPDHIIALIRDALRRIKGFGTVRVWVNPADLERVRQNRVSLLGVLDGVENLEIVEDRRVEAGSCRIETEQGTYDARICTQLEMIEGALRQAS